MAKHVTESGEMWRAPTAQGEYAPHSAECSYCTQCQKRLAGRRQSRPARATLAAGGTLNKSPFKTCPGQEQARD